ncbi:superoxide dismutase copper chaperone [Stagonosporopsis vannaccii]|nr:superoxide dismutase copper chaperone [Stagonosporopsis vannaccii]
MTVPAFETTFAVPMTCEACIKDIEGSLSNLSGINKITANLKEQLVSIEGTAAPSAIVDALQASGRDAILRGSGKSNSKLILQHRNGAAVCILESHAPHVENKVRGLVRMVEVAPSMTIVDLSIRGLSPGTYHATVREAGDISEGPESTGAIWEALKAKKEGKPCRGIFGTVEVGKGGIGSVFLDRPVQIWEMIGRSIVVARQQDGKFDKNDPDTLVGVIARSAGVWDSFSPPGSCLEQTYTSQPIGSDTFYTWVDTFSTAGINSTSTRWFKAYRGRDAACFPSHYPKACEWLGTVQQQQNYIYSPATCPGGYASATTRVDDAAIAITTATCCPSGYALSTVVVNVGDTFYGDPVTCTSVGTSIVIGETTTTFEPDVLTLYAPTVMVAWQNSDIARWKTALPTSTSTDTGSLADTSAPSSGLSTGAKAGIGVGCAVVAIVALAGLLLFFRRRSQKKRRNAIQTISMTPKESLPQPVPFKEKGKPENKDKQDKHNELGDEVALQEISSDGRRLEADVKSARAELP